MTNEKDAKHVVPLEQSFNTIATFSESVLHLYCGDGDNAKSIKSETRTVRGFESDPALAAAARDALAEDIFESWSLISPPVETNSVDCIVVTPPEQPIQETLARIEQALPTLQPFGLLLLYIAPDTLDKSAQSHLAAYGLTPYPARGPRPATRYTLIEAHQESEDPMCGAGIIFVRTSYDPVQHAESLLDAGKPDAAFQILDHIPKSLLADPVAQLLVTLNLQLALLSWAAALAVEEPLHLFYWAQQQFYRVLNLQPRHTNAYVCQAEFWRLIGHEKNALHLLRSINHVSPDPALERRIKTMKRISFQPQQETACHPWSPDFKPRILLINHANSDCGIDVLYDGLCRVLGSDHISEYPWKHFWHGQPLDEEIRHPSPCDHPGEEKSVAQLEHELRSGHYDLILFSDYLQLNDRNDTERLLAANPDIPIVVADAHDDGSNLLPEILRYIKRDGVAAYFKREMLQGIRYPERTYPMPLAYSEGRIPESLSTDRSCDLFWAGHRHFGLRRIYLDFLEEKLGRSLNTFYTQEEYAREMDKSLIGLDIFGLGYDTIRYWELAAHGCMLLAEEKPTVIPHNFIDGESAVFFHDLPELEEKLDYYLTHRGEAAEIAVAGHTHFKEHHTASARARQFLGNAQYALGR